MIKLADKKLKKLGFKKIEENEYCSVWERTNKNYKHKLEFHNKKYTSPIMLSITDDEVFNKNGETSWFSVVMGLNHAELKACTRKMKELNKTWGKN